MRYLVALLPLLTLLAAYGTATTLPQRTTEKGGFLLTPPADASPQWQTAKWGFCLQPKYGALYR